VPMQVMPVVEQNAITVANMPSPAYASHRGGAKLGPQNTMPAYNKTLPYDQWLAGECDVFQNASGSLVLWHDTTIDGSTLVADTTDASWSSLTQAWPAGTS